MLTSKRDRYGTVAVTIHWLSAVFILALLGSGFEAATARAAATKAEFLRFHMPVAIVVLLLTALRIIWWLRFDRKPLPVEGSPSWQDRIAGLVHVAFYVVIVGMVASGIGMMILSGAAPAIFGKPGAALANFSDYPPHAPHVLGAFLLVALVTLHTLAALYHEFIHGDRLLRRMWYGG